MLYYRPITKLLEEAVALLGALPEVEQDRAAQGLFAFTRELNDYELDAEQPDASADRADPLTLANRTSASRRSPMICSVVYRFRAIPFFPQSRLEIAGFAHSAWHHLRGARQSSTTPRITPFGLTLTETRLKSSMPHTDWAE